MLSSKSSKAESKNERRNEPSKCESDKNEKKYDSNEKRRKKFDEKSTKSRKNSKTRTGRNRLLLP